MPCASQSLQDKALFASCAARIVHLARGLASHDRCLASIGRSLASPQPIALDRSHEGHSFGLRGCFWFRNWWLLVNGSVRGPSFPICYERGRVPATCFSSGSRRYASHGCSSASYLRSGVCAAQGAPAERGVGLHRSRRPWPQRLLRGC